MAYSTKLSDLYTLKEETIKEPKLDNTPNYQLPTSTTQDAEKSPKLPHRSLEMLMMNTSYPLNPSCSKEIVVGLNGSDQLFLVEVQIVQRSANNRFGVALSQSEWDKLIRVSGEITKFFDDATYRSREPIILESTIVSFQNVYGKRVLVIYKQKSVHSGGYLPDEVIIRKQDWDTIMVAKRCISQAIQESSMLTERAKTNFDILSRVVVDHLRNNRIDYSSRDQEIAETIIVFLDNLEIRDLSLIDPSNYLLCFNICLFCIPVFVSRFKLCSLYSCFGGE